MESIAQLTEKWDGLVSELLGPLRTSKQINQSAFKEMLQILDQMASILSTEDRVEKTLVGKLWMIFPLILAEADHARQNKESIEMIAWEIEDKLAKIFGPKF